MISCKKSDCRADSKDRKIQKKDISAKNGSIRIEKCRNAPGSRQNSETQRGNYAGISFFHFKNNEKRIKEHWEKQQFHMFPYGFIDWCKKPYKITLFRPIIQKMQQRSGNQNEKKSNDGKTFLLLHEKSPRNSICHFIYSMRNGVIFYVFLKG